MSATEQGPIETPEYLRWLERESLRARGERTCTAPEVCPEGEAFLDECGPPPRYGP